MLKIAVIINGFSLSLKAKSYWQSNICGKVKSNEGQNNQVLLCGRWEYKPYSIIYKKTMPQICWYMGHQKHVYVQMKPYYLYDGVMLYNQ